MALQRVSFPSEDTRLIFNMPCSVEGHSRTSHLERSSSPSQSSSRSIEKPHNDDETLLTPRPPTTVTFQDAQDFLANGRKMLREWNRQWGTGADFSYRAANAFLGIGLVEVPADRARGEIPDIIKKGREALLQLESIAFIDFGSIQVDDFPGFWIETMHVIEGLKEQVTRADAALEPRSSLTRT